MIINLQDVKRYLDIKTNDNDDVLISDIIKYMEQYAKTYIGMDIESGTKTEYFDGNGDDRLFLKHLPVTAITSIHDDGDRAYGADTLISSDDYTYISNIGVIKFDGTLASYGVQNIKVIYVAGYTDATMPEDIKNAVIKLVASEYLVSKGQIATIVGDTFTVDRPRRLKKEAEEILDRYKRILL